MVTQEKVVRSLQVGLGERSYEIRVGHGLGDEIRQACERLQEKNRSVAVVTDAGFASAQPAFLKETFGNCPSLELPPGETTKSLDNLGEVWDFLASRKLDRSACLFVVGGGVVGDLGGFAAATFLRRLRCWGVLFSGVNFGCQIALRLFGVLDLCPHFFV